MCTSRLLRPGTITACRNSSTPQLWLPITNMTLTWNGESNFVPTRQSKLAQKDAVKSLNHHLYLCFDEQKISGPFWIGCWGIPTQLLIMNGYFFLSYILRKRISEHTFCASSTFGCLLLHSKQEMSFCNQEWHGLFLDELERISRTAKFIHISTPSLVSPTFHHNMQ